MMAVNGTTKPCLCSSWGEIMSSQFRELRNLREGYTGYLVHKISHILACKNKEFFSEKTLSKTRC